MKHQKLLVTGGAGFIGSNFCEIASRMGHELIVLDAMTYAGFRGNLDGLKAVRLVEGDICDTPLVARLLREHQIDAVIAFAAESHVDRSITGPQAFIKTNIDGTFSLLTASLAYFKDLPETRQKGFTYLQVSTDEVYGSLGPTGYFSETTPYQPNSPYSASKASSDMLTRAWHHTFGLPTLTTNCSNNYGPRQFPEKLIPHMIECALAGKPLPIYGDGKNIRDWIHVADHCRGILLALEKGTRGGTYCFGGSAERNNLDVVHGICDHLDQLRPRADKKSYRTQMKFVEDRLGHDRRYAIDDSLAVKTLGFKREFQFESGLKHTVQWYLEHRDWVQAVQQKNDQINQAKGGKS